MNFSFDVDLRNRFMKVQMGAKAPSGAIIIKLTWTSHQEVNKFVLRTLRFKQLLCLAFSFNIS